jgi:hypothetical protein
MNPVVPQFAKDILSNVEAVENYFRRSIFSDEATFYLSVRVNCHNCRIWGSENSHVIREDSAQEMSGVLSCSEVLDLFFFADQTVTAMTYLGMLQLYSLPQLEDHQPNAVLQQDGAPPLSARVFRESLDMRFPGRWFRSDRPIPWPPRSPDIVPLDFFLWGYVKDIANKTSVTSLDELKLRIVAVIERVTLQKL